MQRISVLLFLLVFCSATAIQAQAPAPKPDPAVKKLIVGGAGHWTYEGENKAGPLGPAGKVTGDWTGQMILGGFFFEGRTTEKGPTGETRSVEIDGYDPVSKNFTSEIYSDDGGKFSGMLTITGNTWVYAGKFVMAGKQYQSKATFVLAPDFGSATLKEEISVDSKTWTTSGESKWTKVQAAPKK